MSADGETSDAGENKPLFPIVAVGASAGGFEATSELLGALSDETGVALVLVHHLDPTQESHLANRLASKTQLSVQEATDGARVAPDNVYIIPPASQMEIRDGVLRLEPREPGRGHHNIIDRFFRSLAEDRGNSAIGVILSGTLSDGVHGLREIKAAGGFTFAQDRASAAYPDMPNNAVEAGHVDFVLPPTEIARELSRLGSHPLVASSQDPADQGVLASTEHGFQEIFRILREQTGVDFSHYKRSTLQRRIHRRMMANRKETLEDYLAYLREHPAEANKLYDEILITVTRFFRDEGIYEVLRDEVFPELVKDRPQDEPIRIWVPACATGEEPYSLAIALVEYLEAEGLDHPIQIFGTDVSDRSIETARQGVYPESVSEDISEERLQRFFTREGTDYVISKSIRGMCIFAVQDVTRDPPFSKIDLVSCRNLLIYLEAELQRRVVAVLHYALASPGFLVLGSSENVRAGEKLFQALHGDQHIFRKREGVPSPLFNELPRIFPPSTGAPSGGQPRKGSWSEEDLEQAINETMLEQYSPPGLVINENLEILEFRGATGPYIEHTPGQASLNVMKAARQRLGLAIRSAVDEAKQTGEPITREEVDHGGTDGSQRVDIVVHPLRGPSPDEPYFLVVLEPREKDAEARVGKSGEGGKAGFFERLFGSTHEGEATDERVERLENELAATREYLDSVVEEYEATNEELRSANEEALSSNEELQSTNEELETAKEELQSTNEELKTLNEEIQQRNEDIQKVNNDLINLLNSVSIPILMLGPDLRIRRWTPKAEEMLNLIPADMGRPLTDINHSLEVDNLKEKILDVLDSLHVEVFQIKDDEGRSYELQIHPYRTSDNKIDGAVLVLLGGTGSPAP